MKKLILTLLILMYTSSALHAYSYFQYDKDKIQLDSRMFYRYIRPQARSIVGEYYLLLKKIHPVHADLITIKNNLSSLYYSWKKWNTNCKSIREDCVTELKVFYIKARTIDTLILNFQRSRLNFSGVGALFDLDNGLRLVDSLIVVQNKIYELLHHMEELLVVSNDSFFNPKNIPQEIERSLQELLLISESTIINQVSPTFHQDFDFLYTNFIRNLDLHVVEEQNQDYLLARLGEFNLAWNAFHMKMVKSNHPTSKQMMNVVLTMHQRWNSILKIILK